METFYMITGILFLLLLFLILVGRYRTFRAIKKVENRLDITKVQELNEVVEPFGYLYEYSEDIFATGLHPWQREMGYCKLYDESAVSMSMIIHCEPVEFEYANTLYLIEFWKGQYGMTTGAEVGIYKAKKPDDYKPGDFVFYQSVSDEELLYMGMTLYKNGKPIVERRAKHWWLTAFVLGECSKPEELSATIQIQFPNSGMQKAFEKALFGMGYKSQYVRRRGLETMIHFDVPVSEQPVRKWKLLRFIAMRNNRFFCRRYLKLTRHFKRSLDRVDFLRFRYGLLAGIALRFGGMTEKAMRKSLKKSYNHSGSKSGG